MFDFTDDLIFFFIEIIREEQIFHERYVNAPLTAGSLTIEELDDVSKVHVVVHDDLTVHGDQSQGQEEDKVLRGDPGGHPDHFPHRKHILIQKLCVGEHAHTHTHKIQVFCLLRTNKKV